MIPQRLGHILSDGIPGVLMFILVSMYEDQQFKISEMHFQCKTPKQLLYKNYRKCENSMYENSKNLEILWATQSIYSCQILCNAKKIHEIPLLICKYVC